MSYSIMTPFKDNKTRDQMLDFLINHYHNPHRLFGEKSLFVSEPLIEPSYGPEEGPVPVVGFNYYDGGLQREYVWQVCKWMALTAGKKDRLLVQFGDEQEYPYIIYDGFQKVGLTDDESLIARINSYRDDTIGWSKAGTNGACEISFTAVPLLKRKRQKLAKIINEEFSRLTELWEGNDWCLIKK